jgi:hypothetical protein
MINQQHPITLPSEKLRRQWQSECPFVVISVQREDWMIDRAAQWGADQELEACCEWLDIPNNRSDRGDGWLMPGRLRRARRPKPPSLKEQALAELKKVDMLWDTIKFDHETLNSFDTIRRALEQLND